MADKQLVAYAQLFGLWMVLVLVVCILGTIWFFVVSFWPILLTLAIAALATWYFTLSGHAREVRARRRVAKSLQKLSAVNTESLPGETLFGIEVASRLGVEHQLDPAVTEVFEGVAADLYRAERFTLPYMEEPPDRLDSIAGARYRQTIQDRTARLANPAVVDAFRDAVMDSFTALSVALPPQVGSPYLTFEVPLAAVVRDLPQVLTDCILPFYAETTYKHGLFEDLRAQLDRNLHEVSGVPLDQKNSPRLVLPNRYKGNDIIADYLRATPLQGLYEAPATISIPYERRFEHMHIVAGTGHGKTQTLQRFIVGDLDTDAGLVVIDSQGEMLKKIAALQTDKEVIYIDPTDLEHPPALNMFDVSRLDGLPQVKREQFLNGLIELLEYVFAGLLKAELTQKQNVLFRYTLRLMLAVPGATLTDLVKFLSDPTPYLPHVQALNPMAQEFFAAEFHQKSYSQTREQIRRRLYGVLENDAFRRMFSAKRNELALPDALNRGAVILVDTAKSHLKADASSLMGRYFIALTLQAALEREGNKNPAFLYIDEAGEYFDDNIDSLLNEARKRRVGIVMAHQYLDQLTPQLRSSMATNTAIKMAGGVSDKDARTLAADMRCEPGLITAQTTGNFACYIKNVTAQAVSIRVPFGVLEAQPIRAVPLSLPPSADERQPGHRLPPAIALVVPPESSTWPRAARPHDAAQDRQAVSTPIPTAAVEATVPRPQSVAAPVSLVPHPTEARPAEEIAPSADW